MVKEEGKKKKRKRRKADAVLFNNCNRNAIKETNLIILLIGRMRRIAECFHYDVVGLSSVT